MVKFGKNCFMQSSLVHKNLPCDSDEDLECYMFLKSVMCKYSKKF